MKQAQHIANRSDGVGRTSGPVRRGAAGLLAASLAAAGLGLGAAPAQASPAPAAPAPSAQTAPQPGTAPQPRYEPQQPAGPVRISFPDRLTPTLNTGASGTDFGLTSPYPPLKNGLRYAAIPMPGNPHSAVVPKAGTQHSPARLADGEWRVTASAPDNTWGFAYGEAYVSVRAGKVTNVRQTSLSRGLPVTWSAQQDGARFIVAPQSTAGSAGYQWTLSRAGSTAPVKSSGLLAPGASTPAVLSGLQDGRYVFHASTLAQDGQALVVLQEAYVTFTVKGGKVVYR